MSFFSKQPKIVVHDGKFHADDLFAAAALRLLLRGKATIVRTRDPKIIESAEYVADVGGIHDLEKNRFDHHMTGGAGTHENGIPYAAFGLVWKKYGGELSGSTEVAARVESKLVSPIDADDNGVSLVQSTNPVSPYGLHNVLYTLRPTWKEDPKMYDTSFMELLPLAERIITREIKIARDSILAHSIVEGAYASTEDKRCIVLDGPYPYQETLGAHAEPLYVVSPRSGDTKWKVECIRKNPSGFENRKSLPLAWAGLRDEEFAKVSGVSDAVFCHNGRFMAVAMTKSAAMALAQIALEQ